jgi:hypothetical protein
VPAAAGQRGTTVDRIKSEHGSQREFQSVFHGAPLCEPAFAAIRFMHIIIAPWPYANLTGGMVY